MPPGRCQGESRRAQRGLFMSVRLRIALTIFVTGALTALGVIATVLFAFQRFEHETTFQRADAFLGRVVGMYDNIFEMHQRQPQEFNQFLRNLVLFARLLRIVGVPASPDQLVDLVRVLPYLDLRRKDEFKDASRATLVTSRDQAEVFDRAFDLFVAGGIEPRRKWNPLDDPLATAIGDRGIGGDAIEPGFEREFGTCGW